MELGLGLININVSIQNKQILNNINLEINRGQIISLLGESGCGKSTTLKAIAGIIEYEGNINVNGKKVDDLKSHKRGTVIVFQDLRLFPHLNVEENIYFPLKMKGVNKNICRKRANELLEMVQLKGLNRRKIQTLSGGQMQRVALARALAAEPKVLLLDEPFSSLDENLRLDMRELVLDIQKKLSLTTILVTHDKDEALSMSDKIAIMKNGEILQYDTPINIYNYPLSSIVADYFEKAFTLNVEIKNGKYNCMFGCVNANKENGLYKASFRLESLFITQGSHYIIKNILFRGSNYLYTLTNLEENADIKVVSNEKYSLNSFVSIGVKEDKILYFNA